MSPPRRSAARASRSACDSATAPPATVPTRRKSRRVRPSQNRTGFALWKCNMTDLPFDNEAFDCAYATESLEHAVEIGRAVGEICRVVKRGGRIAIIDKNARIGNHVVIGNSQDWTDFDGENFCVRDKIVVIPNDAIIPDGTVI